MILWFAKGTRRFGERVVVGEYSELGSGGGYGRMMIHVLIIMIVIKVRVESIVGAGC